MTITQATLHAGRLSLTVRLQPYERNVMQKRTDEIIEKLLL